MGYSCSFGAMLRSARKRKRLSGNWIVQLINGHLVAIGANTISLPTYYSWERIGTPLEKPGRAYPHPAVYRILEVVLEIDISQAIQPKIENRRSKNETEEIQQYIRKLTPVEIGAVKVLIESIVRGRAQ